MVTFALPGKCQAGVGDESRIGNETPSQRADGEMRIKEQHSPRQRQRGLRQARAQGLGLHGPFGAERAGQPDDRDRNPCGIDIEIYIRICIIGRMRRVVHDINVAAPSLLCQEL
jgi:hypothetical protein